MTTSALPADLRDPINAAILAVSEDRLQGFHDDPFGEIARVSQIEIEDVLGRLKAMLASGTIRRIRQTLLSTRLAASALVAWKLPPDRLDAAFDYMFENDPFSGHVVLRSTDPGTQGSDFRLWTTLKVPQGFSLEKHCTLLGRSVGATAYRAMPARCLFVLGVGHVRRRSMLPGAKSQDPPEVIDTEVIELSERDWRVLKALKREFAPEEIRRDVWPGRAAEAGLSVDEFCAAAHDLDARGIIGRFSTFLEHVKPLADGARVTRYNGLFHWAVPEGSELKAGREIGRHYILTHAYWRPAGPEFGNVNIMGVVHGLDKDVVLQHKAAIDDHLRSVGIPVRYTNVFWGGRSEIKPSEIMPASYISWCESRGINPDSMRE
ncbi:MAG TPA: Lrp/AsnC family transcriptional regulator [Dehalococcoidia bacterium]|nr:Lrp/AsnC family transcriptional regulator [Dehalococcoidia bacterium]